MSNGSNQGPLTFLMVGCQRCGTTWIDAALRDHPEVYLPPDKQSYFFDRHYERGIDWYLERFDAAGPGHRAAPRPPHSTIDGIPESPHKELLFPHVCCPQTSFP